MANHKQRKEGLILLICTSLWLLILSGCRQPEEIGSPNLTIEGMVTAGRAAEKAPEALVTLYQSNHSSPGLALELLAKVSTDEKGRFSLEYPRRALLSRELLLEASYEEIPNDCIAAAETILLTEETPDTLYREFRLQPGGILAFALKDDPELDLLPECCWQLVVDIQSEGCSKRFPGPALVLDELRPAGRFMVPAGAATTARWTLLDPDLPGRIFSTGSRELLLAESDSVRILIPY